MNRTDRTNWFYEGIDNPGLVLLHDILMTYCMYDFDLGETPPSSVEEERLRQCVFFALFCLFLMVKPSVSVRLLCWLNSSSPQVTFRG